MDGWIKIHRKILEWEWYDDPYVFRVFFHFLMTANYEDKKWHGIVIKRGQRVCSYPSIAEELAITIQNVRTAIGKLKSTGELTHKPHSRWSVVTVNKYEDYQTTNSHTNSQLTGNQQAANNNIRNIRNKEIKNIDVYTFSSINYLKKIPSVDITEFTSKYQVTFKDIVSKADDLINYCEAKGKVYKNYKAFLSNALKRDFGERKQEFRGEVSIDYGQVDRNKKIPKPI